MKILQWITDFLKSLFGKKKPDAPPPPIIKEDIMPTGFTEQRTNLIAIPFTAEQATPFSIILQDTAGNFVDEICTGSKAVKGKNVFYWDKRGVKGNMIAPGNYIAKVAKANDFKAEWEGGVGNTSSAFGDTGEYKGYNFTHGVAASADKLIDIRFYNEAEPSICYAFLNNLQSPGYAIHTRCSPLRVRTDGNYFYFLNFVRTGAEYDAQGRERSIFTEGIFALSSADFSQLDFSEATDVTGNNFHDGTYRMTDAVVLNNDSNYEYIQQKTDFDVQRSGDLQAVAIPSQNVVRIRHKITGALIADNSLQNVKLLCFVGENIVAGYDGTNVNKYSIDGGGNMTLVGSIAVANPEAIVDLRGGLDGSTLRVIYSDPIQQIKNYNISTAEIINTIGQLGGYSTDVNITPDRFFFTQHSSFAEVPGSGDYFLLDQLNYRVLKYSSNNVHLDTIAWLPAVYKIGVEKPGGRYVYAGSMKYEVDYTKPLTQSGSWVLRQQLTYKMNGYAQRQIFDVVKFSNGRSMGLCRIDGDLVELIDLTTDFVPTGITFQQVGQCNLDSAGIWYEDFVFYAGDIARRWLRPITGWAGNLPVFGQPQKIFEFAYAAEEPLFKNGPTFDHTARLSDKLHITYDCGNDNGYHLGLVDTDSNRLVARLSYSSGQAYNGPCRTDSLFENGSGTTYAGTCALAMGDFIVTGQHGEFYKGRQLNLYKVYHKSGAYIDWFGWYPELYADNDPNSIGRAGNSLSIVLVQVSGLWYLYTCDESFHGRIQRWKLTGLETITFEDVPVTITSGAIRFATDSITPLTDNIPHLQPYSNNWGGWINSNTSDEEGVNWQVVSNLDDLDDKGFTALFGTNIAGTTRQIEKSFIGSRRMSFYLLWTTGLSFGGTRGMVQIKDNLGKVLIEIEYALYDNGGLKTGLFCNSTLINEELPQSEDAEASRRISTKTQIDIAWMVAENKFRVIYGGNAPVLVAPMDSTANPLQFGKVGLYFNYAGGYSLGVGIGIYKVYNFKED